MQAIAIVVVIVIGAWVIAYVVHALDELVCAAKEQVGFLRVTAETLVRIEYKIKSLETRQAENKRVAHY